MLYLYYEDAMVEVRFPQSPEKLLERLAKRTGRTKSFYVLEAIFQHLEDLEDIYLSELSLEKIRSGE